MLNLNETVLYGTTGVCTVESIEEKRIGNVTRKYYVLKPVQQLSSTVFVPADNERLLSKMRRLLSPEEIKSMLHSLPKEPNIWLDDDNERKIKYNEIISSGDRKACLVLLRTLHSRQKKLAESGKRLHMADERAMKEAQRLIHDEFSFTLNIKPDEVVAFIRGEIKPYENTK